MPTKLGDHQYKKGRELLLVLNEYLHLAQIWNTR